MKIQKGVSNPIAALRVKVIYVQLEITVPYSLNYGLLLWGLSYRAMDMKLSLNSMEI